jgi:hypothetical protein
MGVLIVECIKFFFFLDFRFFQKDVENDENNANALKYFFWIFFTFSLFLNCFEKYFKNGQN